MNLLGIMYCNLGMPGPQMDEDFGTSANGILVCLKATGITLRKE